MIGFFANDTSLFTVVYDENIAASQLNSDLQVISQWAHQWKMQFNPEKAKQSVQVKFSQNRDESNHPLVYFNESEVLVKHEQKRLGMIPDSCLNFHNHVRQKIIDARKGIGIICYMSRYVTQVQIHIRYP